MLKRIYEKKLSVPFYDADYLHRMKVSAILKEFSQLAGEDYIDRGMSHQFLSEHGGVFLVSRVAVRIVRYPTHGQRVTVSTWEPERRGPLFIRAYAMTDEAGNLLAEGESGWLYVEINTRKIVRPRDFPWLCPTVERATDIHIAKLKSADGVQAAEHPVTYSDMDANGHLYNATYGDIITNTLSREEYERDIDEIYINYVREAKYGDVLHIFREDGADGILLTGKVDDAVCFESRLRVAR
jgi:medium-chain acyl-[acyl-carrier-protein] hydrolase